MPTSLDEERAEQRRWRLHPEWAHADWPDRLLADEFLSEDEQHARQTEALGRLVRFCAAGVPFYQEVFRRLGIGPDDVREAADLVRLPVLTKLDVQERAAELRPQTTPIRRVVVTESSGTTGRPTQVEHTRSSRLFFPLFKQREYRWFRFDPSAVFASIRLPSQMPKRPDGRQYGEGETCRLPAWRFVGSLFETGPYVICSATTPADRQIEWLQEHQPGYLMSYPSTFEQLTLAYEDGLPPASLRGLLAIATDLTPQMRRRIEGKFGLHIHQNYGLNELGLVASTCREGGRYHVHAEHSLVEIIDEHGKPCRPGETGRVLVSNLTNEAMPLLRCDTGDFAQAVGGPCPCGRTLPAFGEVAGRYSRRAFLPEGTFRYVVAVQDALAEMPLDASKGLRQYQVHQFRDGSFELRLVVASPLSPRFAERINEAWRAVAQAGGAELRIVEVAEIPRAPGGKYQDFTSDFFPARDEGQP